MQPYEQLQWKIGAWSAKNFGKQETPYLVACWAGNMVQDVPRDPDDVSGRPYVGPAVVRLGGLAPLMGIGEELGELHEHGTQADQEDALGDMGIYLCDYCCHEGIVFPSRVVLAPEDQRPPAAGMVAYYGQLLHCHLKRHQRIRGMHDKEAFNRARMIALQGLVWHTEAYAREVTPTNLLTIMNVTWNDVVKKRDWNNDAVNGGGHNHKDAK